jgi:hypothetical protein
MSAGGLGANGANGDWMEGDSVEHRLGKRNAGHELKFDEYCRP